MTVSAHDVAAALRQRLPGVGVKKVHKLLYYCQGHHLAAVGEPLFVERVSAWDMGPVVAELWRREQEQAPPPPAADLTEQQLNTIGYVVSRYGALSGRDLEHLTHSEAPWQWADARRPAGQSARIEPEWMRRYFAEEATADDDDVALDAGRVSAWLEPAAGRRERPVVPDDLDRLRARLRPDG